MKVRLWPRKRPAVADPDVERVQQEMHDRETRLAALEDELHLVSGGHSGDMFRRPDRRIVPRTP